MSTPKNNKIDQNLYSTNKKYKREEIKDAKKWFNSQFKNINKNIPTTKINDLRHRGNLNPLGRLCYFIYQAKGDGKLPYWDMRPLVIMISEDKDHFIGLNLHYLPTKLRALLLGKLIETINNVKFDQTSYLNISYNILKSVSKYQYFKPCIKQYLKSNIKSKINVIRPQQWHQAISLPVAKFKGSSSANVWAESKKIARQ